MDSEMRGSSKVPESRSDKRKMMGVSSLDKETQVVLGHGPEGIAATVMQMDSISDECQLLNCTSCAKTKTEKSLSKKRA